LWAITPRLFQSFVLPPGAEIEKAARKLSELLVNSGTQHAAGETPKQSSDRLARVRAEFELTAASLSSMLLGPVADQLGKKRLVIVSEGALQYVPFAALPEPQSLESRVESLESRRTATRTPDSRLQTR